MMKISYCCCLIIPLLLFISISNCSARDIHVNLTTNWLSSPVYPILETSEFLAEENPKLFWKFVDAMTSISTPIQESNINEQEAKELAFSVAKSILPKSSGLDKVLELVLATRVYSPTIEMYRHLALESVSKSCDSNTKTFAIVYQRHGCADSVVCDIEDLKKSLSSSKTQSKSCASSAENDFELEFDHLYIEKEQSTAKENITVVLYGVLGSEEMIAFHKEISNSLNIKSLQYIYRHFPSVCTLETGMQGYGVSLDIKNMEYKTIDDSSSDKTKDHVESSEDDDEYDEEIDGFLFNVLMKRKPEIQEALKEFRNSLVHKGKSDEVKAWDIKDLGLAAVNEIMKSKDPFKRLQEISQDFPKYAKKLSLSGQRVPKALRNEVRLNREILQKSKVMNKLLINGISVDPTSESFNAFDVLRTLRTELSVLSKFNKLDIDSKKLSKILAEGQKINSQMKAPFRIYVGKHSTLDSVPFYLNNIEEDDSTKSWSRSLDKLRSPTWNLIMLRRNMYHMDLVIDITDYEGILALSQALMFMTRGAPIRFGLILTSTKLLSYSDEELKKMKPVQGKDPASVWHVVKLLYALKEKHDTEHVLNFLIEIVQSDKDLTAQYLSSTFAVVSGGNSNYDEANKLAEEILLSNQFDKYAIGMTEFARSKGFKVGTYFFNGMLQNNLNIRESIMQLLTKEQHKYADLANNEIIDEDSDIFEELMNNEESYSRYVSIMEKKDKDKHVSLTGDSSKSLMERMSYLHPSNSIRRAKAQSLILLLDLGKQEGVEIAVNAMNCLESKKKATTRLSILHVAQNSGSGNGKVLHKLLRSVGDSDKKDTIDLIIDIFEKSLHMEEEELVKLIVDSLKTGHPEVSSIFAAPEEDENLPNLSSLAMKVFEYSGNENKVFLNGQEIQYQNRFSDEDFRIMLEFDFARRSRHIGKVFGIKKKSKTNERARKKSDIIMQASSVTGEYCKYSRESIVDITDGLKDEYSVISGKGNSLIDVRAYIDPLSETAQRASSFLRMLHMELDATVSVVLIPPEDYGEFPLKRFYRYIFDSTSQGIQFRQLPIKPILTLKLDTPEAWNVQLYSAQHDLDNLRVNPDNKAEVRGTVLAEFRMKSLIVGGQCADFTSYSSPPPNGLQLLLERAGKHGIEHRDTLVMRNLGYFQFQATPGVWNLRLAPGRASELFNIVDEYSEEPIISGTKKIVIRNFDSDLNQLRVMKKRGKEEEKLLDPAKLDNVAKSSEVESTENPDSIWNTFTNFMGWSPEESMEKDIDLDPSIPKREGGTIHVFSLASGHLYERFLKIMMLSVLKRTQNPVKFWLLENFLSPDFKKSVPILKKKFGMDIGLVTYKWPNWLRKQTEKQRIIWGYKILFLDVLFPLDVKKIIYVDADQVVRADLKELWDMDLQGHVYGYTPFCASRKETLGFQFWRSGYWKDHLQGRPYHISALYVVDLAKFRRVAAGDLLRAIYDNLSRDPNSLANLDQDLPNYAQDQVPIFSLPQDWLWCESWCSDESKTSAKTIDLCNNPLHKEPKLDMAKRVISGNLFNESWLELDQEIRTVEQGKAYLQGDQDNENIEL